MLTTKSNSVHNKKLFDQFNGKSVLITGSTGLVGSNLLAFFDSIIDQGISVSLHSTSRGISKSLFDCKNAINYKLDLCNNNFEKILPEFDFIFHCAGYGQPLKFLKDGLSTISLNTSVLLKLIECLSPNGKIIYISSSEVYAGFSGNLPNENDIGNSSPGDIRACYIEGKRCGETIINNINDFMKSGVSIRLALAYGPGTNQNDQRVLNQFIKSAIKKNSINLLDQGKSIRRYIFIDDAIEMILNIATSGVEQLYNVGGKERVSIIGLAKIIQTITGCSVIVPKKSNGIAGAPQNVGIDISRYQDEFGEIKFKSLREGLKLTIDSYKNIL
jgi:nucleoside-diphosphate-sugar epimerase